MKEERRSMTPKNNCANCKWWFMAKGVDYVGYCGARYVVNKSMYARNDYDTCSEWSQVLDGEVCFNCKHYAPFGICPGGAVSTYGTCCKDDELVVEDGNYECEKWEAKDGRND